jgi:hypothetical protein
VGTVFTEKKVPKFILQSGLPGIKAKAETPAKHKKSNAQKIT